MLGMSDKAFSMGQTSEGSYYDSDDDENSSQEEDLEEKLLRANESDFKMSVGGYSTSIHNKNGFQKTYNQSVLGLKDSESLSSAANVRSKHKKILGARRQNTHVGSFDENKVQLGFAYQQ